ncbi:hypothetical protein HK101_001882 [Irineochytrium annulatum]|nr:hypothetical protein HK101_001882 [Irineochytrium annulatum]
MISSSSVITTATSVAPADVAAAGATPNWPSLQVPVLLAAALVAVGVIVIFFIVCRKTRAATRLHKERQRALDSNLGLGGPVGTKRQSLFKRTSKRLGGLDTRSVTGTGVEQDGKRRGSDAVPLMQQTGSTAASNYAGNVYGNETMGSNQNPANSTMPRYQPQQGQIGFAPYYASQYGSLHGSRTGSQRAGSQNGDSHVGTSDLVAPYYSGSYYGGSDVGAPAIPVAVNPASQYGANGRSGSPYTDPFANPAAQLPNQPRPSMGRKYSLAPTVASTEGDDLTEGRRTFIEPRSGGASRINVEARGPGVGNPQLSGAAAGVRVVQRRGLPTPPTDVIEYDKVERDAQARAFRAPPQPRTAESSVATVKAKSPVSPRGEEREYSSHESGRSGRRYDGAGRAATGFIREARQRHMSIMTDGGKSLAPTEFTEYSEWDSELGV